jgi:thiol-disulfide isomerase/thioredoxin
VKFLVPLIVILLLVACSPAAGPIPVDNGASGSVVGSEGGLYPPQDLSLIASTGRPQFIHSYADWCTTCQHNHPFVEQLMTEFGDKMDFIHLNIDLPETLSVREEFGIIERSHYLVTDAGGNIVQQWYGILDEPTVEDYIKQYLAASV